MPRVASSTTCLALGAALALTAASAPIPARAEIDVPRPARCLLTVNGIAFIDGPCLFTPLDRDGSFEISTQDAKYFAYVTVVSKGLADGWWNEDAYAGHAHTGLGRLAQNGACWENATASVCAW